MQITDFTVEKIIDPTGILAGNRYEFFFYLSLNEEDELNEYDNLKLRALFSVNGDEYKLISTYFLSNEEILGFELEEEEEKEILAFCQANYLEADEN